MKNFDVYEDAKIGYATIWDKGKRIVPVFDGKKMIEILADHGLERGLALETVEFFAADYVNKAVVVL